MVISFSPEDLLQFFTLKDGMWRVRCDGLPEGTRVVRVEYSPMRHVVRFVLENDDPNFGYLIGKYQEPLEIDFLWEAEGEDEDRTHHSRS
jgi:hypothetical protein